jgi:hypothetical protein
MTTSNALYFITLVSLLTISGCDNKMNSNSNILPLEGTWQLISETKIEKGDTTFSIAASNQRMIKIINKTHFAFLRHDLNKGQDTTSASFVAGGGSYNLTGNTYQEHLEFCNFREWENHDFSFEIDIKNDTLTQQGREKIEGTDINRIIIEKYFRVSK